MRTRFDISNCIRFKSWRPTLTWVAQFGYVAISVLASFSHRSVTHNLHLELKLSVDYNLTKSSSLIAK